MEYEAKPVFKEFAPLAPFVNNQIVSNTTALTYIHMLLPHRISFDLFQYSSNKTERDQEIEAVLNSFGSKMFDASIVPGHCVFLENGVWSIALRHIYIRDLKMVTALKMYFG